MPASTPRRFGLAAMATSLVLGAGLAGAAPAAAAADFDLERIAGDDRYATAAKAATAFGAANTVILASGQPGSYPDALTANYLAGLRDAPVLLTKKDETPEVVKKAIADSGAKNVIIVGGSAVVSEAQEQSLRGTYSVRRIAGADRFATAAAVIAEGDEAAGNTALLATGLNFPDALGAGPAAFAQEMPLAITKPSDAPDDVVRELKQAGITRVLVLGGETAVGKEVVTELENKGITVEKRFNGADRAETSTLFAQYAIDTFGFTNTAVNVASGYVRGDGADALGGAPLSGQQKRALLITKSDTDAGEAVLTFLDSHAGTLTEGILFGGANAVSAAAEAAMEKAVLGSGAQNTRTGEFYNDVQAAIDAAQAGDTVSVFGAENAGFTVNKANLTIQGDQGAAVTEAIVVQGVDGANISGLTITPSNVGGQIAGIYLNDAEDVVISGNEIVGANNGTGAGVINEIGGADEVASISENTLRNLQQGVFANPSAEFTIDSNEFRNNTAGSANDAASTITNNTFVNNDEGVGLGVIGSSVEGNYFANNAPAHVGDYTADAGYDLEAMIAANRFDEAVEVTADGKFIRDAS